MQQGRTYHFSRRIVVMCLVGIFSFALIQAQTAKIDSLQRVLESVSNDRIKVQALNSLAAEIDAPAISRATATKAYSLALSLKDSVGIALSLNRISHTYNAQDNYSAGIQAAEEAVRIAESINDTLNLARAFTNIGTSFWRQGNYDAALDILFKALALQEEIQDTIGLAATFNRIGTVYSFTRQYSRAYEYFSKSLLLAQASGDKRREGIQLNNIGDNFMQQHRYDSAITHFSRSHEINKKMNNQLGMGMDLINIGESYIHLKEYDKGEQASQEACKIFQDLGMQGRVAYALRVLSELSTARQKYSQAIRYAIQSFQLADSLGARPEKRDALKTLTEAYNAQGDSKAAFEAYKSYVLLRDSIVNDENSKKAAFREAKYNTDKKDKEILLLRKDAENQALVRNSLLGGLCLVGIIVVVLIRNNAQRKKANDALNTQAAEIQVKNSKLEESYQTTQILSDIGREIASSLNIETVFAKLYERVNLLMDADGFVIGLADKNQHYIQYKYIIENGKRLEAVPVLLSDTSRLSVQCYLERREILDNDRKTTAVTGFIPHSVMFVPLIVEDRCIGILSAQAIQVDAYKPHHLMLLSSIASIAATALDNAAAYKTIQEQSDLLQEQAQEIQITNTALQEQLETLRRTQSQLAQAEKMASLGTLVAGVAHELNTPIGVAVTAASTLHTRTNDFLKRYREGGLKKSELEAYLETAQMGADLTLRNMQRAADLIQSFKRVAVDQTSDEQREFNLGQYLYEIVTSLQPMLKGRGAQIMVSVPSDISFRSYPGALSQIITNLVQNSVKHGFEDYQADAVMTITVKSPKGKADDTPEVVIEFADNGRGIPEAILPRIFDPFFTTKPGEQGGTGLGLNIVYNLVTQKLGGKLQCFSEINVGTRFIMTLPFAIKT